MRFTSSVLALAALASTALAQPPASWEDNSGTTTYDITSTVTMTLELVETVTSYGLESSMAAVSNATASASTTPAVTVKPSAAPTSTPSVSQLPQTGGVGSDRIAQTGIAIIVAGVVALFSS